MLQPESEYFYLMSHWQIFDGLFIDSKWLMGRKIRSTPMDNALKTSLVTCCCFS